MSPAVPAPNSRWIEPGRLLAGGYPGAPTASLAAARLRTLIDAGITYFIDLTEAGEHPPYDHLLPPARADDGRYVIYVRKAIRLRGLPQRPEQMVEILDYLARALEVGHQVYLHGGAGTGRSNLVAGCWMRRCGASGPQALERLRPYWPEEAATKAQWCYVDEWTEPDQEADEALSLEAARVLRNRYTACLLGLACGDAIGATTQLRKPGTFAPVGDMLGGGHWQLPRGAWTDDTAMTLCLADSLLALEGFSAEDQLRRYRSWQQQGRLSSTGQCIGISSRVAAALSDSGPSQHAAEHAPDSLQPLTRIGAVVLFAAATPAQALSWAWAAVELTDRSPMFKAPAQAYAAILLAALRGASNRELLTEARSLLLAAPDVELAPATLGLLDEVEPAPDTGIAPPAGLGARLRWILAAVLGGGGFRDGLLRIVNWGGDADVHGALYGQLAGVLYGAEAIPKSWRNTVLRRELLQDQADRLLAAALAPRE